MAASWNRGLWLLSPLPRPLHKSRRRRKEAGLVKRYSTWEDAGMSDKRCLVASASCWEVATEEEAACFEPAVLGGRH